MNLVICHFNEGIETCSMLHLLKSFVCVQTLYSLHSAQLVKPLGGHSSSTLLPLYVLYSQHCNAQN